MIGHENDWGAWSKYILSTLEKLEKYVEEDSRAAASFRESHLRELLAIKAELLKEVRDLNENSIAPLKIKIAVLSLVFGGLSGCAFAIFTSLLVRSLGLG